MSGTALAAGKHRCTYKQAPWERQGRFMTHRRLAPCRSVANRLLQRSRPMTQRQRTSRMQCRRVSPKPANGRAETFDKMHGICATNLAGLGETRPTENSPPPPKTAHFGEFDRPAAQMPSPKVVVGKRVTKIADSNAQQKIHHQHHGAAESGETLQYVKPANGNPNVTPAITKAWGESTRPIAKTQHSSAGGLVRPSPYSSAI